MSIRPPSHPAPIRRPAALVRELAPRPGTIRPEVILEARPALDFIVSLVGDTAAELLPADATWLAEARDSLSAPIRHDLDLAFGHDEDHNVTGWALVPLAMADRSIRTSADVVALAGRVTARELVVHACCADEKTAELRTLAARYYAGETDLAEQLIASAPEDIRPALERLVRDPAGELRALRRVLRAWRERFVEIESRVAAMQERDVAARQADLARMSLVDFVERTTNGVRWTPDASIRKVHLSPTYFGRPYNYLFGGDGWYLFGYPLSDEALDGDRAAVPQATVRLFRALGDESRMRILRYLADGDLYLTEIAERMNLSKPTVKHHLAQLRAAGLVTVTETGGLTYYSIRRDRLADAGLELAGYLGGTPA